MAILDDDRSSDMCPICKTDKYLSPNMNFLINPECYHRICESCVDRIFSLGPAPCPYPDCGKILRKNKFKQQIFDNLSIEREIDIRKKVGAIYNKTEEDFSDLVSYNEYLEKIEDIIFKLNNGIDKTQTELELYQYEQEHKLEILEKNIRESQKNADAEKYKEAMETLRQAKLNVERQRAIEDLDFQRQQQQELLDTLTNSNSTVSAEEIIKQQQANALKRASLRKKQLQQVNSQLEQKFNPIYQQKLLEQQAALNRMPFTPFQGDRDLHKQYTLLPIPTEIEKLMDIENHISDSYNDPYLNKLAKNKEYLGAGWRLTTVYERALDEAFIGLGCIIEQEKGHKTVGAV